MTASHFDLWLTNGNRVYRAVPYEVLADWLQQGRVAPTDHLRPAGGGEWRQVNEVPALAVYLPREAAPESGDRAEALEPVELDVAVRHRRGDEDEDVDMIPLIDISLVLLIFFMMTATVAVAGADLQVPEVRFATLTADRTMFWVGMKPGQDNQFIYSLGEGVAMADQDDDNLSLGELVNRFKAKLDERTAGQAASVRIAANRQIPFEAVRTLTRELEKLKPLGLVEIKAEVREKAP